MYDYIVRFHLEYGTYLQIGTTKSEAEAWVAKFRSGSLRKEDFIGGSDPQQGSWGIDTSRVIAVLAGPAQALAPQPQQQFASPQTQVRMPGYPPYWSGGQ